MRWIKSDVVNTQVPRDRGPEVSLVDNIEQHQLPGAFGKSFFLAHVLDCNYAQEYPHSISEIPSPMVAA